MAWLKQQLDALIERRIKGQTRTIHETQDMLNAAMVRGPNLNRNEDQDTSGEATPEKQAP